MRLALLIFLALFLIKCGDDKRPTQPTNPTPSPSPVQTPTPQETPAPEASPSPAETPSPAIPIAWATPYPTPVFNPASYLPSPVVIDPLKGVVLKGVEGEDYSAQIQAAQDDPDIRQVIIGPGLLKRPVVLRKYTKIALPKGTVLACDITEPLPQLSRLIPLSDYGCFLVANGVYVEGSYKPPKELIDYFQKGDGRNWATDPYFKALDALSEDQILGESGVILEPTFISNSKQPQVSVFQALNDVGNSHTGKAQNITIKGVAIKGRQTLYDGGVRSTILLGNCHSCSIQDSFLWDTASIGTTAGGSALERDNFADGVLFYRNIFSGVPAANMAAINTRGFRGINNYVRKPGNTRLKNAAGQIAGGGICGFDNETNSGADHTEDSYFVNNLIDFQGAFMNSAGNGICMQDPYSGKNRGEVVIANNVVIGGRGERSDFRYMSNGIFVTGMLGPKVVNNYIFRTGQNGLQIYNVQGGVFQDNDLHHTGGGGNPSIHSTGVRNSLFRRNYFRSMPGLDINAHAGIAEVQGSCGNTYEDYRINGVDRTALIERAGPCVVPSASPR